MTKNDLLTVLSTPLRVVRLMVPERLGANVMLLLAFALVLAWLIVSVRLPAPDSLRFWTTKVAGTRRSSSASRDGRKRRWRAVCPESDAFRLFDRREDDGARKRR